MRKHLYLDIKDAIKSIVDGRGNPVFKHFDLWNQQVEFIEQETPFETPAIFIEFGDIHWRTLGLKKQDAETQVSIHIVTEWFANTADYVQTRTAANALEFLRLPDVVVHKMQNHASSIIGNTYMRIISRTNHNHERYVDSVEVFKCNIIDTSAIANYIEVTETQPVISASLPNNIEAELPPVNNEDTVPDNDSSSSPPDVREPESPIDRNSPIADEGEENPRTQE